MRAARSSPHVCLIGFSGSGKSTIGRLLARRLGRDFVDLDLLIEHENNISIPEIFRRHGERRFRRLETAAITRLMSARSAPFVIALGGGAFQLAANRSILQKHSIVVYLSCPVRELYRRLKGKGDRPMLQTLAGRQPTTSRLLLLRIRTLLNSRRPYYDMADMRISTCGKTLAQTADELARWLMERYADS
jgi:shikimate kinase